MGRVVKQALVILAVVSAVFISLWTGIRLKSANDSIQVPDLTHDLTNSIIGNYYPTRLAESCYPFRWQQAKRQRLSDLLHQSKTPPVGNDSLALARYAEYALRGPEKVDYEAVMREGMRRDPRNALYHYLLADFYLQKALTRSPPKLDKTTGKVTYYYQITDRSLLDRAMRELAIGTELPYSSRRATLLRAQLDAMPPAQHFDEQLRETSLLTGVLFPEFAKMRNFMRVNGFYLSLLLKEGKRQEAEPYLHTGERVSMQLAQDNPPTLISMLVALACSNISKQDDASVCRQYGLTREATGLERRHTLLMSKVTAWKTSMMKDRPATKRYLKQHASILGSLLSPVMGKLDWLTPDEMRPSRLVEFTMAEKGVASFLPLLFLMLMLFAGLKIWRWRLATRGSAVTVPASSLTAAGWWRVLLLGMALPVALYLLYTAIPQLSGRDTGVYHAIIPFVAGLLLFVLWLLIVPGMLAVADIHRQHQAADVLDESLGGQNRFSRASSAVLAFVWSALSVPALLWAPVGLFMVLAMDTLPPLPVANIVWQSIITLLLLGGVLLPAVWERKRPQLAGHYIALSRALIPVYAVLILFISGLTVALDAAERHYMAQDHVIRTMREGDLIAFTYVEGRLVQQLRGYIHDGAKEAGLPWDNE